MSLHLALIHYPTIDKHGAIVCTSVTNLDVHDFGRLATTYAAERVWLVHPYKPQQWFISRVLKHWRDGWGAAYNPTRQEALASVELVDDILTMREHIEAEAGRPALLIGTSARRGPSTISYADLRAQMTASPETPYCIVFGTGWGMHPEAMEQMDMVLEPIKGPVPWNHLSVRAAAAIIVDRLRGE